MNKTFTQSTLLRSTLMVMIMCVANIAQAELVHSYEFNNSTQDTTGNVDGTVYGAQLTSDRFGQANNAYSFDGNDSISMNVDTGSTATYSVWATWNAPANSDSMLFNTGGHGEGPDLWFNSSSGCDNVLWNTWDGCGNPFSNTTASTLRDNAWRHYTVVNDATTNTKLYIDGELVGTAAYKDSSDTFLLGRSKIRYPDSGPGGPSHAWVGSIDDVKIYNSALTSQQVSELHTFGSVQSQSNTTDVSAPVTGILSLMLLGFTANRRKFSI
jgi:hypothetical protein